MAQWHALVSLPFVLLSTSALAATKVGIVGAANPVLMAQSEGAAERELHVGDVVFLGEKLRTTESGSAQLMFLDRSALTISPNSAVTIDQYVFDPATELGEMSMSAGAGAFRFIGGALSKKNPVTIKTPVSTIGIRGGVGDAFVEPQGQTQSVFHHGDAMSVTNANGITSVTSQPGTGFSQETPTSPPAPMTQTQLDSRASANPVQMASNVAPSADATSLQKVNTQLQSVDSAPPATTTPAPQSNAAPPAQTQPATSTSPATPATTSAPTDATPAAQTQATEPAAAEATAQPTEQAKLEKPATDQPLSESEVNEIRTNPQSLQEKFPKGGVQMANYVTRAIATDPTLANSLGGALEGATPAQSTAIGTGLARGGRLIAAQNPQALEGLNQSVKQLNDPRLNRVYNAIGTGVQQIGEHPLPNALQPPPATGPKLGPREDRSTEKRSLRQTQQRPNLSSRNRAANSQLNAQGTNSLTQPSGNVSPLVGEVVGQSVNNLNIMGMGAVMLPTVTSLVATTSAKKETVSTSPTK